MTLIPALTNFVRSSFKRQITKASRKFTNLTMNVHVNNEVPRITHKLKTHKLKILRFGERAFYPRITRKTKIFARGCGGQFCNGSLAYLNVGAMKRTPSYLYMVRLPAATHERLVVFL